MHCKLKRPVVAAVALCGLLLAACSSGGSTKGGPTSAAAKPGDCPIGALDKAPGPVDITFWHAMAAGNGDALKKLADQFNQSQPKVKVTLAFQGSYEDTLNKYLAALKGGSKPDLLQMEDKQQRAMIDSRSMVAAADCYAAAKADLSDMLPKVKSYYTVDGKLWSYPFNVSDVVLYFNKLALAKAGLDANTPLTTMDEVRAASKKVVAAGVAKHGIATELAPEPIEQWFAKADQLYADRDNGRNGRAEKVLIDNDTGLRAFTTLRDMVADGTAFNVGRNDSATDNFLAIPAGNAVMTMGSSASLGIILSVLASGQVKGVDIGVAPMPGLTGNVGGTVGGASLWVPKNGDPAKVEAGYRFATWLQQPAQQAQLHQDTGYLPLSKAAVDLPAVKALWAKQPYFKVGYDQLVSGPDDLANAGPVIGPFVEEREAVVSQLEAMLLQGKDPKAALDEATKRGNDAIATYNKRIGG